MSRGSTSLVIGFHGMTNYGDDLFQIVLSDLLPTLWPEETFIGFSSSSPLHETSKIKSVSMFPGVYSRDDTFGAAARALSQLRGMARSSVTILGGGSLLQSPSRGMRFQERLSKARSWRAIGTSIGPFSSDASRAWADQLLSKCTHVALRDQRSVDELSRTGFTGKAILTGDLAALYDPRPISRGERRILFAPCANDAISDLEQLNTYRSFLRACAHSDDDVVVLSANNHQTYGDDTLAQQAVECAIELGFRARLMRYADLGVAATWDIISGSTLVLATRLHVGLTAYLTDTPFVLLEYHPKCTDFLNDIGQSAKRRKLTPQSPTSMWHSLYLVNDGPLMPSHKYRDRAQSIYQLAH